MQLHHLYLTGLLVSLSLSTTLSNGKTLSQFYDDFFQFIEGEGLGEFSIEEQAPLKDALIIIDDTVVEAYKNDNSIAWDSSITTEDGTEVISQLYLNIFIPYRDYDDDIPNMDSYAEYKYESLIEIIGDLI